MKKLIVLGMALALMLSVAPAMAGDFGALKDIATTPAMTDTELASVEGQGGLNIQAILIGNVAIGAQGNALGAGAFVSQSNTAIVCQSTSVSVIYAPDYSCNPTWIYLGKPPI